MDYSQSGGSAFRELGGLKEMVDRLALEVGLEGGGGDMAMEGAAEASRPKEVRRSFFNYHYFMLYYIVFFLMIIIIIILFYCCFSYPYICPFARHRSYVVSTEVISFPPQPQCRSPSFWKPFLIEECIVI